MADVSGHGVSSAFVTVLLKSYMGGYLERHRQSGDPTILDPAAVLTGLNREILDSRHGKYLTMFYGVLSRSSGRLHFANGGQFPLPILFDGARSRPVGGRSPPVGLFEDAQYETGALELPPAFTMTLFSDGILETLPQSGLAGKQQYLLSLASGSDVDAAVLARSLRLDDLGAPPDDITVLSLRRMPHDRGRQRQLRPARRHLCAAAAGRDPLHPRARPRHLPRPHLCAGRFRGHRGRSERGRIDRQHRPGSACQGGELPAQARWQEAAAVLSRGDINTLLGSMCLDEVFVVCDSVPAAAPAAIPPTDPSAAQLAQTVLAAHRLLCDMNENNRALFHDVVDALQRDLDRPWTG